MEIICLGIEIRWLSLVRPAEAGGRQDDARNPHGSVSVLTTAVISHVLIIRISNTVFRLESP